MKQLPYLWICALACLAGFPAGHDSARGQDRYPLAQAPTGGNVFRPVPALDTLPPQIAAMPDVTAQMKVIQRRSQLVITKGEVVRTAVADPTIADIVPYSPTEFGVLGLELGSTTLMIWLKDNPDPLIYLVETIRDPSLEDRQRVDYGRLEQKLTVLFPNSKVYLIPLSTKIIVKGQARDSEEAARILSIVRGEVINQNGSLAGPQRTAAAFAFDPTTSYFNSADLASSFIVNMLEVPGEFQVMLRVRIAELKRSMLRRMGVNFEAIINDGQAFFSSVLAGTPATLTGIFSSGDITVLVNALESNGTAKVLAEPNITVLSGHPASFLSGGEFAVPTIVGIQGVGGQQTTFRGFGVSLVVIPTVIDRDLIRMQVLPEFSAINNANAVNGIPGVNTRRVQTTVELREGQTIALAGLLENQTDTEVTRLPVLGAIPIIGPVVFAGKRATQDETELIILVTPELVRPMEADEVPPLPGHEVTHPNDCELYWHGMTEGAPDQNVYQLAPYGNGSGQGIPVGYSNYNPAPASPGYGPAPTNPFGGNQGPTTIGPGEAYGTAPFGSSGNRYQVTPPTRRNPAPPAPGNLNPQGNFNQPPLAPIPNPNLPSSRPTPIGPSAGRFNGYSSPAVDARTRNGNVPASYTIPSGPQPRGYGGRY